MEPTSVWPHLENSPIRISGDWETLLSLREQQLLAFGHILLAAPRFAFLDRVGTALGSDQVHKILHMLSASLTAYISNGEAGDSLDLYDAVLVCRDDGGWAWTVNKAKADSDANESGGGALS
jgi:vitamin B12/bleomycin/antimicrobial peptide transport system ATP-binding/permease protein